MNTFERISLTGRIHEDAPKFKPSKLEKHRNRIENELRHLQQRLALLEQMEKQEKKEFKEIKGYQEVETWEDSKTNEEFSWIDYQMKIFKIQTDTGEFLASIDYKGRIEELEEDVFCLHMPNQEEEKVLALYEIIKNHIEESVILLHDYQNIRQYLRTCKRIFTCIQDTPEESGGYYKERFKNIKINEEYKGYLIHDRAYIKVKKTRHFFNKEYDLGKYFIVKDKEGNVEPIPFITKEPDEGMEKMGDELFQMFFKNAES